MKAIHYDKLVEALDPLFLARFETKGVAMGTVEVGEMFGVAFVLDFVLVLGSRLFDKGPDKGERSSPDQDLSLPPECLGFRLHVYSLGVR